MASEEQYLDQLLKSMMDNEPKTRSMDEVMREMLGEEAYAQKEAELSKVNSDDSNFDESSTDGVNIVAADSDVQNPIETEEMPVQSSFDEVISNPEEEQGESVISSTAQEEKEEELVITPDALADMLDMLDNPDMFVATEKQEESETVNIDMPNEVEQVDSNIGLGEELSISQDELAAMLDEIDLGAIPQPETVQSEVETVEPVVDIPIVEEPIIDIPTEEPVIEEFVAAEPAVEMPIVEEPVAVPEMPASDPNAKMSDDDIAAMIASMNTEEPVAETPVVEEPVVEKSVEVESAVEMPIVEDPVAVESVVEMSMAEEPVAVPEMPASDPNAKMSDDDIAAMIAAMNTEEPAAETPVAEEPVVEEPVAVPEMPASDPNAKMSDDDIAALFAAMNTEAPAAEEPVVEEPVVEESVEVESAVEMPIVEDPVVAPEMPASDPNAKMSDDDIAALFAAMNTEAPAAEEPAAETPAVEEPAAEEPVAVPEMPASDPNAKMSDDDIAALFAAMNTEEPVAETPVVEESVAEEPAVEESVAVPEMPASDPNAKMSDDDIAALFAAMNTEEPVAETPVVEESVAEEPIVEEPVAAPEMPESDPNAKMSDDDIAALFAAMNAEEPAAEEPVVEEPVAVPEMPASDPNAKMSDDDIAALFAAMNTEEPSAEEPAAEEPAAETPAAGEPVVEEPVAVPEMPASDPNAKMSDDDIAALFAAMNAEEPAAETPAVEEPAAEEPVVEEPVAEAAPEMSESDPNAKMSQDDIAAMIAAMNAEEPTPEESTSGEPVVEAAAEMPASDPNAKMSQDDIAAMIEAMNEEEPASEEPADSNTEMSQDDLAALLSGIDDSSNDTSSAEPEVTEADPNAEMSQDDIAALLSGIDSSSSDNEPEQTPNAVDMLEKIGDSDEDLLALLEGIDENASSDDSSAEIGELLDSDEDGKKKKDKKKKEKKPFKLPFFGKKKVETADGSEVVADVDEAGNIIADSAQIDALIDSVEINENGENDASDVADSSENSSNAKKGKKKKQKKDKKDKGDNKSGFLAGLIALFFDEEEEEEKSGDLTNEEILEAVDAENQETASEEGAGKKGKKGKKDKKDKKGKKGKNAEAKDGEEGEGEEGEGEGDAKKAKKPKKEKKVKEPKEPVEKVPEKRVLSKKATVCLVAFCATLIAAVVILSNILPEHAEISKARAAYYKGDFETVYRNLYNKNLNESDAILYKRAQSVMTLKRRWDSYNNRVKMDRPVEALDSLLEGVYIYNSLKDNADSDIRDELDELYYEIVGTLQVQYGLTADDAVKVYEIEDEEAYTKVLYSIVYNDVWYLPGEEPVEEPAEETLPEDTLNDEQIGDAEDVVTITLEDMLPEEEDF